jgi:hypothetical protein
MFTAIDYNSYETPFVLNDIRQYKTCKWSPNNRIHKRTIYVKQGPNDDGVQPSTKGLWIDTTNPDYDFRGLIYSIEPSGVPAETRMYTVEAKFYMMFKSPK